MLCQYQDQIHLQLGLDIRTIGPIGIFRLVVHHILYGRCQCEQFVLWIFKAELMGNLFQNIVESLFLVSDT